ncbi:hypothetical protein K1719_039464 [Acacia pycnantha]|nr:hypothetical protein K1719_039464 [Acacia pycnantha]
MFRMEPNVVLELENILVSKGWLHPSRELTSLEALSMFLWTCAHSETNRNVQNRFGKSGETISRKFSEVLDSLCSPGKGNCEASDFQFEEVPSQIRVCSSSSEGKYYLVDLGYSNMKGYLAPFKGERYHIPDFRGCSQPQGIQEVFNHAHSSLRNVIERTIGVWKNKWHILRDMKPFPLIKQEKIIIATIALHNFIRKSGVDDEEFDKCDLNPDYIPEGQEECDIDEEMTIHSPRRTEYNGYMNRVQIK